MMARVRATKMSSTTVHDRLDQAGIQDHIHQVLGKAPEEIALRVDLHGQIGDDGLVSALPESKGLFAKGPA